jgi:hypothetical protein
MHLILKSPPEKTFFGPCGTWHRHCHCHEAALFLAVYILFYSQRSSSSCSCCGLTNVSYPVDKPMYSHCIFDWTRPTPPTSLLTGTRLDRHAQNYTPLTSTASAGHVQGQNETSAMDLSLMVTRHAAPASASTSSPPLIASRNVPAHVQNDSEDPIMEGEYSAGAGTPPHSLLHLATGANRACASSSRHAATTSEEHPRRNRQDGMNRWP